MPTKRNLKEDNIPRISDTPSVRASISFPQEDYKRLEELAGEKRVSLAWVVREAVRVYLKDQRAKVGNQ